MSETSDDFQNILNSIKPIRFKFSTKSLQFDKIFDKLSLESLEKRLYLKRKPPATFKDSSLYKNIEKIYGLSKDAYGYLEDINGVKKMPIKIEVKGIDFNKNLHNAQLEKKVNEFLLNIKEESKNINQKARIIHRYNTKIIKKNNSDLIPRYYHPNYDFVRRRIPAFEFGKSKKIDNFNESLKNSEDKNKENQKNQENITEGNKNFFIKSEKISFDNYNKNANMNNPILKLNLNDETKNESTNKNTSRNKNEKENNTCITQRSLLPNININQIKNKEKKSIVKKLNQHSKLRKITSTPNIISFKKMRGRYDGINRINKSNSDIFYKPNYNYNAPHIPSYIFNASDNRKDLKKYKIGKLIRSYAVNSYKYEIMDINKNNKSLRQKDKTKLNIELKKYIRNKIKNSN